MTRWLLIGVISWLLLGSFASSRAIAAEEMAVAFVKNLGGKITRDDKRPGKPVVAVDLHQTDVSDADLKELTPLKSLTLLILHGTKVTDTGVKELASLKNLNTLFLFGTKVTVLV